MRASILVMDDDVREFATTFSHFLRSMTEAAASENVRRDLRAMVDEHLGMETAGLPVITRGFSPFDHANLQVALAAYLARADTTHQALGLSGQNRHFGSFADLLELGATMGMGGVRVGRPDYVELDVAPDATLQCVQFGVFLIDGPHGRLAALMRGPDEHGPHQGVTVEVIAVDSDAARAFLVDIARLMLERNIFRGQVLSFGDSPMGHMGVGPLIFHMRPEMTRDALILPPGILEQIELEVLGIGEHRERLRRAGQHVKRGVLLHGPPGTGKTHTVRYLVSRATPATVLIMTGGGLHMLRHACALARMLQPSMVVLEDIDLVAHDRGMMGRYGNPLLFDVLNELDGMAEDADVAFLLTTNRADVLEPALAARPGRVDLAVEVGLPDDDARRRLVELYARELTLRPADVDVIVQRTEGVTASFIKELLRKAALLSAARSDGDRIGVEESDISSALDELLSERSALTRVLLGGARDERAAESTAWLSMP